MVSISTSNLDALPDVHGLQTLLNSLAVLDAILSPDWGDRFYSFDSKWSDNEQMGSMRNGTGDEFFALFNSAGCFFKGFSHEQSQALFTSDMLGDVPNEFSAGVNEPAFSMEQTSFCFWRLYAHPKWSVITNPALASGINDGSEELLKCLNGDPRTYLQFAEENYDVKIPVEIIRHVYDHLPLTDDIVKSICPESSLAVLSTELNQIGYPRPAS